MDNQTYRSAAEECFWKLLRCGLWSDKSQLQDFMQLDEKAWEILYRISLSTGTYGILSDAIVMLPEDKKPADRIMKKYLGLRLALIRKHTLHNMALYEILRMLRESGFRSVLLKGQGVSLEYLQPDSRACGDIDLYIGESQIDAVLETLKEKGIACHEEIDDNEKHAVFFYKDLRIELHRYSTFMSTKKRNKMYSDWWDDGCLTPDILYVSENGSLSRTFSEDSEPVYLPPTTHNLFFLFYHALHHFIGCDVPFRQFCDVAVFLRNHRNTDLDEQEFGHVLDVLDMTYPWEVTATFLNRYLGLPEKDIPCYRPVPERVLSRFVDRLRKNVFYRKEERIPKGRIRRKMSTYHNDIKATLAVMRLFPRESVRNLALITRLGLRNLFNENNRDDIYRKRMQHTPKSESL